MPPVPPEATVVVGPDGEVVVVAGGVVVVVVGLVGGFGLTLPSVVVVSPEPEWPAWPPEWRVVVVVPPAPPVDETPWGAHAAMSTRPIPTESSFARL